MTKKWYNFFVVSEPVKSPEGVAGKKPAAQAEATPKRAVELAPEPPPAEAVVATPVPDPAVFDDIYAAARIDAPSHGYSILKVAEMLASEHLRELPPDVKKRSILVALDAAGVPVDEVVQDAVRRDRALDTYERLLVKNLDELRTGSESERRRIEEEINNRVAELKARLEENRRKLREEEAGLEAWTAQKRREEARIAEAVGYFVTENPVTTSAPPTTSGGDNVR